MRVNMRSTSPMDAALAGTKLPICAMRTISAVCLMYVDFPAMLGPGDNKNLMIRSVQEHVIGNIGFALFKTFHYRVTSLFDTNFIVIMNPGPHIASTCSLLRE